jgi:galactokinase
VGGAQDLAPPSDREARRERLAAAFRERFGRSADAVSEAPGRVNLIGEHVDYNEGHVLPVAVDRTVMAAFAARRDRRVHVYSLDFEEESAFSLDKIERDEAHPWSDYVRGVAHVLQEAGHAVVGLDVALQGDVPIGAGLSSSAALEVAALGAFRAAGGLAIEDRELALLGQRAENEFVGVSCGIMDQFVAALAVEDHALLIDCRSLDYQAVATGFATAGLSIVVADTGVRRALAGSQYNVRRRECTEALALLQGRLSGRTIRSLRDVTREDLETHAEALPPVLYRRARHVVEEEARVLACVDALRQGDFEEVGRLLAASHASLRDDYEVSCRELDLMVELAQAARGVIGARLTGAGFGGCTVNLVRSQAVGAFEERVIEVYCSRTGLPGRAYVCRPVGGLAVVPVN